MPIDTLYPDDPINAHLKRAFSLIDEALSHLKKAEDELIDGDEISSDSYVMRAQTLLPELFCLRSIGDGFGAIINSIQFGIQNMDGNLMSREMIRSIANALKKIRTEPFLDFDTAVDEIIQLDDSGLETDPKGLGKFFMELF